MLVFILFDLINDLRDCEDTQLWGAVVKVDSTLAFVSIGHGFDSEHRLFSHHSTSVFSKLRLLSKCSLDDSVRRLL